LLAGTAGALGATLSGVLRLRDLRAGLVALRSLKSVMVIQPLVGAAFALLVALILDTGFAGIELPTDSDRKAAALAIFGFIAGFSEPFALGIVNKVAALEPPAPSGEDGARQAPRT
jgi:hypothetical protein